MSARVLDGRAIAAEIRASVAERAAAFAQDHHRPPCLAAVVVGDDPASLAYARAKARTAERIGMGYRCFELPSDGGSARVVEKIRELNDDDGIDGILVELPLPPGHDTRAVQSAIDPLRDVDGVTPDSMSRLLLALPGPRSATAQAVMAILEAAEVNLVGRRAVVVGRSAAVGKPTALLLLNAHATVTLCHTRTVDMPSVTRTADVLVAAAGVAGLITAEHVQPGATVVDVGTNPVTEGEKTRLVGDVNFDAVAEVAGRVTPVPGGVGPVTTATILRTTVVLAEARAGAGT